MQRFEFGYIDETLATISEYLAQFLCSLKIQGQFV